MSNGVSRETFDSLTPDGKLGVLFDFAHESYRCACEAEKRMDSLEKKFDKRKKLDTAMSTVGGVFGGLLASLGIKIGT